MHHYLGERTESGTIQTRKCRENPDMNLHLFVFYES